MEKIPKHLQLAIEHEKNCIRMREEQIKGYKEKIKLLEKGIDYNDVLKKIKPRKPNIKFNFLEYNKLKRS